MATFELIARVPFTTTNGKTVYAEERSVVRVSPKGRVMLVKTIRKDGNKVVESSKERPTTAFLRDIKHAVQPA